MRVCNYAEMYAKQFGLKEEIYKKIGTKTYCNNGIINDTQIH